MLICCSTQFSSSMLSPMLSSQFQFLQLSVRVIALPQNIYYHHSRSKNLGTLQLVDVVTITSKRVITSLSVIYLANLEKISGATPCMLQ